MIKIVVDLDNTLSLNNAKEIKDLLPNDKVIERLKRAKSEVDCHITVATARGALWGNIKQRIEKYESEIHRWLQKSKVPYDCLSFNKDYADIYIDDKSIHPADEITYLKSYFTDNDIAMLPRTVVKKCSTAEAEAAWYYSARSYGILTPKVLFVNKESIITERIYSTKAVSSKHIIQIIERLRAVKHAASFPEYRTYIDHISWCQSNKSLSKEALSIAEGISHYNHDACFYHGDLSIDNVIVGVDGAYVIDPAFKGVFGSHITDAAKAYFSFIAYGWQYSEAKKIADHFGKDVIRFAVTEGIRVAKYRVEYSSIVNNIADILKNEL